ncbi:MAG: 30S ribosomal protein S16, partial [Rhodothermales bacterium]
MSVKLRLRRMGRKKRPVFAIVAADSRFPRDGRYIEDLGRYNPLDEPATLTLNPERCIYWLENGAQPSDTVRSLLSREGVMLALHMRRKG